MRLKNINGTSERNCACGIWLKHWNKYRPLTLAGIGALFGQNLPGANATQAAQAGNAGTPGFWDAFGCARELDTTAAPVSCPVIGCSNKAEVGAHVQKDDSADKSWYVIPLCKKHNSETGKALEVRDDPTLLAAANVALTCGKNS